MSRASSIELASLLFLAGCSIEQTRSLGDDCVQVRECAGAAGTVACLPRFDGRTVCTAVNEAGVQPMQDANSVPDATADSDVDASNDVATDTAMESSADVASTDVSETAVADAASE